MVQTRGEGVERKLASTDQSESKMIKKKIKDIYKTIVNIV